MQATPPNVSVFRCLPVPRFFNGPVWTPLGKALEIYLLRANPISGYQTSLNVLQKTEQQDRIATAL